MKHVDTADVIGFSVNSYYSRWVKSIFDQRCCVYHGLSEPNNVWVLGDSSEVSLNRKAFTPNQLYNVEPLFNLMVHPYAQKKNPFDFYLNNSYSSPHVMWWYERVYSATLQSGIYTLSYTMSRERYTCISQLYFIRTNDSGQVLALDEKL